MGQFTADKAKWQWDDAYQQYVEDNNIVSELTDEQEEEVWALAAGHITYFFSWIIKHDIYNKDADLYEEDIEKVKNGSMSAQDLFAQYDFCLTVDDIDEKYLDFMNTYYEDNYLDDYFKFMESIGINKGYIKYDENIYKQFEPVLDIAFEKWSRNV